MAGKMRRVEGEEAASKRRARERGEREEGVTGGREEGIRREAGERVTGGKEEEE